MEYINLLEINIKMLVKKSILILLLSILSFGVEIQPLTENIEPWQIKNGDKLSGVGVEIIREIQKRIGNTKEIKVLPWNRIYNMCLKKEGYAIFSTSRTPKREKLFKWVGPLYSNEFVFFKHSSNKKVYTTLEDAKKASSVAVVKNDVAEQTLQEMGFKNLKIDFGKNNQMSLQKLLNYNVELVPSGRVTSRYKMKQLQLEKEIVQTEIPPFLPNSLYIAFNIKTDDSTIRKWQKALDDIKEEGLYDKIMQKYR